MIGSMRLPRPFRPRNDKDAVKEKTAASAAVFYNSPLWPCEPSYNLHVLAGGLPLAVLSAPNIRLQSKLRREVCNPTEKSNIPNEKCGSKWARHAPSRELVVSI